MMPMTKTLMFMADIDLDYDVHDDYDDGDANMWPSIWSCDFKTRQNIGVSSKMQFIIEIVAINKICQTN